MNTVYQGDCREVMRRLIAEGVHVQCIVTSPPYFGLRDYGHPGQLGLEPTPAEYVAGMVEVFGLARELLADDGVLWLNLGDSYAANGGAHGCRSDNQRGVGAKRTHDNGGGDQRARRAPDNRLKPKDLIGIPWRVAFALQQPQYIGRILDERDRIWLAAIIDGEGCFFIHKRKAGTSAYSTFTKADGSESNYERTSDTYGVGLEICNTNAAIIDRVREIVPTGTMTTQGPEQNGRRKQTIYRWRVAPNEAKRLAQELYPYLVGKRHQARLIYNCPSNGDAGSAAHQAMMILHNGGTTSVDYASPPTMFGPGWYLRQDIIWSKKNPMPESVRDRCTKAHEYVFLMSKSERYFYDAGAISEPHGSNWLETRKQYSIKGNQDRADGGQPPQSARETRNRRSVWTIATQPYAEAHFATMPEALVEPCILAGSRPGDTIFDPFMGSGTVASVAQRLGRRWLGSELNPAYIELIERRTRGTLGLELMA